ncbi:MAG: M23 family metallopeptidase [Ignavibacteriales bacterium]|nr:M23 family metallopeptidase [Ignavibacteriales bacterium]
MDISKIKNIKDYSFLIIPNFHGIQTKSHKLSGVILLLYIIGYTIVLGVFFYLLFSFTPAKYLLPFDTSGLYKSKSGEIQSLSKQVYFLTRELESLSSLNKKLRIAITMGDSQMIDSIKQVKKKIDNKVSPYGGNILFIIQRLFFPVQKDSIIQRTFFMRPIPNGFVSQKFEEEKGHFGIDFAVKTGTPVLAAAGGYIIFADYTSADGYMIIIQHENNYTTVYKHCAELNKKVRDHVVQGETIALSGNTGFNTTGPHLHFEIWQDGQTIDPTTVLIN